MPSQTEIRTAITSQIIEALKSGGLPPWRRPWVLDPNCGLPLSLSTLRPYRGINVLILALAAMKSGFRSRWWGSYQAIKQAGGYVRRGERATTVVFFRPITRTVVSDTGEEEEETFPVMRTFCVFNAEQTSGLEHLRAGRTELAPAILDERYEQADAAIAATEARIVFGGNEARYSPTSDQIELPFRHQFASVADYFETLAHEMVHWSQHPTRLNWEHRKAEHSYALGELIAEIGACFLCAELGLPTADTLDNHHAYVKSWISALENDPKFIFTASAQASKAVDYLLSFSRTVEEPEAVLA
jgi:antirestriction protein ArdC